MGPVTARGNLDSPIAKWASAAQTRGRARPTPSHAREVEVDV